MALSVIIFSWDVGLVTITISVILAAIDPAAGKAAMSKVSWSIVILICGVLTYIAVLQEAGTVEWVSAGISAIGVPLLAALLLFYMSGLISALASSLAIIGVVIALAVPFLESGDVHVGGFVAALAIAATIVDISPFSTNGAMLLANVHSSIRDRYYRQMIGYAGLMCLIGPRLAWVVASADRNRQLSRRGRAAPHLLTYVRSSGTSCQDKASARMCGVCRPVGLPRSHAQDSR